MSDEPWPTGSPAADEAAGESPFWERPEIVERFAAREPDERLRRVFDGWRDPATVTALDLGCAGGRNTVWLARQGCRVTAVDASTAMVERTRQRLTALARVDRGRWRVRQGRMDELGWAGDGAFDLVVALGVFHNALGRREWDRALAATARVLAPGGRLLVASFTPETDLTGEGMRAVSSEPGLYVGSPSGPLSLRTGAELDREMAAVGLLPERPTETVRVDTEIGRRVTANGLYEKPLGP